MFGTRILEVCHEILLIPAIDFIVAKWGVTLGYIMANHVTYF